MNLPKLLLEIDWATVLCFLVQVLASSSLPTLSKLLLTHLGFPYPATLAFVHTATVSICLWFWTILNIFHPRSLPMRTLLPLSLSATVNSLLAMFALSTSSLLHFQLSRFIILILLDPSIHAIPFLIGTTILFIRHCPTVLSFCILAASVVAACIDKAGPIAKIRSKTRGTDLQLQLMVRSIAAVLFIPILPLFDDFSSSSALPSRLVASEDSMPFFLYSTGLLAFFAFVSVRVSHSKLHPNVFRTATVLSGLPVFVAHFAVYESPGVLDIILIAVVLFGIYHVIMVHYPDEGSSLPDDLDSSSEEADSDGPVSDEEDPTTGQLHSHSGGDDRFSSLQRLYLHETPGTRYGGASSSSPLSLVII